MLEKKQKRQVIIITGMSGAGKGSTIRALEDLGFYCVDNLPIPLLSTFLDFLFRANVNALKIAVGIDARGGTFLKDILQEIEAIKSRDDILLKVIFLDAKDETIIKRFQETRRAHPLAQDLPIKLAIKNERTMLEPLKHMADEVHGTDSSNIHELRRWVRETFVGHIVKALLVNVISFGFKYGVPSESNLVYDVRFLPNPFFVPELKPLDGREKQVQEYLFGHDAVNVYWQKFEDFLRYLLICYYEEGRAFANVAIGCTGGKHRSVAFVERLCKKKWPNIKFLSHHRDVGRE